MSGAPAGDRSGQVAVITGGAGGIGSATAELLAGQGAAVVSVDAASGTGPRAASLRLQADVTDAAALRAAGQEVAARFGGCDALIICAGVAVTGPAGSTSDEDWDRVFAVNVRGAWLTFREFLPVLR